MHVNLENAEKAIEAAHKHAIALKTQISKTFCAWTTPRWAPSTFPSRRQRQPASSAWPPASSGNCPSLASRSNEHSNDGLITFPGGLPIVNENGVLVGAIGGSSVENDHKVAEAGVEVLGVSDLPEHPWRT